MLLVAQKKSAENHKQQKHVAGYVFTGQQASISSFYGNENIAARRKPCCPCDGECLRCAPEVQNQPARQSPQEAVAQARLHAAKCPGKPLTTATCSFFEPLFGWDLSDVRVHTCAEAVGMCQSLNAQAFTYSNNIYFNKGKYDPETPSGNKLLAHELTHVVQRNSKDSTRYLSGTQ